MLLNSLRDIPSTRHARRERDKVTLAKRHGSSPIGGSHRHFSRQQVTTLILIICPRKLGYSTTPCTPRKDTLFLEKVLVGLRNDLDFFLARGCHEEWVHVAPGGRGFHKKRRDGG